MKKLSFRDYGAGIAAWVQAALLLALPFLRVNGESALRFDVPSLKLYFFGSVIWISEAYFFLLVFLLFFLGIMLDNGPLRPHLVRLDVPPVGPVRFRETVDCRHGMVQPSSVRQAGRFRRLSSSVSRQLVAADLIWYFVSPYDMIRDSFTGRSAPGHQALGYFLPCYSIWTWPLLDNVSAGPFVRMRDSKAHFLMTER